MPEIQWLVFGLGAVLLMVFLLRGSQRGRQIRRMDPQKEAQQAIQEIENSPQGVISQMESRLYDYSREVEARIQNRLDVLDQLILAADEEIDRLESALKSTREREPVRLSLSDLEHQVQGFSKAGFSSEEIAAFLQIPGDTVQRLLKDRRAA